MASLIVITVVLFLVFLLPIVVAVLIPRWMVRITDYKDKFALEYPSKSNLLNIVDLVRDKSMYKLELFVWLLSILLFGAMLILLELSTRQRFSSAGAPSALEIDIGILPPLFLEICLTVSIIALAFWWLRLKAMRVRNVAIYAIGLWILSRCVWFLPQPFVIDDLTRINLEVSGALGNQVIISSVATLACISVSSAIIAALLDSKSIIQWGLLAFSAPFVTMFWILEQVSFALLFLDVTYPAMILGAAIWKSRRSVRMYPDFKARTEERPTNFSRLYLTLLALLFSLLILLVRVFVYPHDHTSLLESVILPWISILIISMFFHVVARWKFKDIDSSSWTAVVFLICLAIVYFPDASSWYPASVNDNLVNGFPMDWHVVGIGIIGITALIISLYSGVWQDARPYMVGMCWPALLQATLSRPSEMHQIGELTLTYWIAPTLALLAVFGILGGVFGTDKVSD